MKPLAFIAMPLGHKPDAAGQLIDFDAIFHDLIKPALKKAGLAPHRADREARVGGIRGEMFQELFLADLVVADVTLDSPHLWFALGVRQALRARGVVLISGGSANPAFDTNPDRTLVYSLSSGRPDPTTLPQDRDALAELVRATMESWHGKTSPVYAALPALQESKWESLRMGERSEFLERHDAWHHQIALARKTGLVGDLLVLADEAPVAAFRAEAWLQAGAALRRAGQLDFALEQLQLGLEIEPLDLDGLREQGICLRRLALAGRPGHSLERVRDHCRMVLEHYPDDAETHALLGRAYQDAWTATWRRLEQSKEEMRKDAAHEKTYLRAAIDSYAEGHRRNPGHYGAGINALTLIHLHRDLTGEERYAADLEPVAGAVRFAARNERDPQKRSLAKVTLADLETLQGTSEQVSRAYVDAIACTESDWLALDSARTQLCLLQDLGFRPEAVATGIAALDLGLARLTRPDEIWWPRQVILFSGHLVDAPDRPSPRFPPGQVPVAARAIAAALQRLDAGPADLALTQGACGGDLLFSRACLDRGVRLRWLQPFAESEFLKRSVLPGGESWQAIYQDARTALDAPPRAAPEALGPPPGWAEPGYAYERCNLWLLQTALSHGPEKVRFVCLWNGGGGDGPGGTAHIVREIQQRSGSVLWLDTRKLW